MRFLLIFVIGLIAAAPHVEAKQHTAKCTALCEAYKHAYAQARVAYKGPLICAFVRQDGEDKQIIMFFDEHGHELDAGDQLHHQVKKPADWFCTGAHWWEKAKYGRVVFCNSYTTNVFYPEDIALYLKQRRTAPDQFVDLRHQHR